MRDDEEDRDSDLDPVEPEGEDSLAKALDAADSFVVADELFEAFGDPGPLRYVMDDGLPSAAPDEGAGYCPPLSAASFVCIADETEFVVRGPFGLVQARFHPDAVEQQPDGRWLAKARPFAAIAGENQLTVFAEGDGLVPHPEFDPQRGVVVVEPIRPACSHYLEQLDPPAPGEPLKYGWKRRYCTFRRTVAGAFLELSHGAIRACNARTPVDQETIALMRAMDVEKIEQGKHRTFLPIFAALDRRTT